MQNEGWEFILNSKLIESKSFTWSLKFNIGINRNKLLGYPNLSQSPYADQFTIGKSLNIVKVLHYIGIDPQTGTYSFQDRNHDGQITIVYGANNSDDRYSIDLSPKFDGGFTNNFSYKNWQLSIFMYFKKQIGRNAITGLDAPGDISNQPLDVLSRWQKAGDITNIPKFTTNPYNGNGFSNYQLSSDAIYTDASFIRLQNLSLSYTLPNGLIKKYGINNFKLYLQGNNLFIITRYNGLDPELQSFGGLPLSRVLTAGISCNF